jgi:transcriptional antiterminator RfaH
MRLTQPAWYCIRSQPKHEHIAGAHLRQIPGVEVFNPRLRFVRSTRRGRVWSTESLFPNYLFARFVLEVLLEKVSYTPAVKSLLRFGERVPAIADSVIDELRRRLVESEPRVFTDSPLEGDEVAISTGPFEGENGVVTRVFPAKQRVQILLEAMGRSISAEFSLDSLLFKRRDVANLVLARAERGTDGREMLASPMLPFSIEGRCAA